MEEYGGIGFLILHRVQKEWSERVAEKIVEARAHEARDGDHEPLVPGPDRQRHDFRGFRRPNTHEVRVEKANRVEG